MKPQLKYLTLIGLAIAALSWSSSEVNATEEMKGEDIGAREAIRKMELQDENGQIPPNALSDAYAEKEAMPFLPEAWSEFVSPAQAQAGVKGGSWVSVGPGNVGGRIRSILIRPADSLDPEADRTMWAGGVAGGVWKTTNSGRSWSTNTDRLANLAVNCMAIEPGYHAPGDDVIYAGTGEGFNNGDALKGNGVYKTTDGGASWNVLPFTYNNPDFVWVNRLAISPSNSQLLLAAVKIDAPPGDPCPGCPRGKILRSTNGGTTWTTTTAAPFPAPMTDVRFQPISTEAPIPGVPRINCLASIYLGQVYYSTDNGATWVTRPDSGLPPPADMQRVELAYSRSNPYIVYASKAGIEGSPTELFRSENGGFSFASRGHPHVPTVPDGGLPGAIWYTNVLWVDPTDPQTVVVGGIFILRTRDGGTNWDEAGNTGMDHLDHHAIVEDPLYDGVYNNTVYQVNDGGIHVTGDILRTCDQGPCVEWRSLNKRLSVTQFYGAAGHGASGTIIGGTQDNGTVRFTPAQGAENWDTIFGGDNAACAIDQTGQPYLYGEWFNLQIFRNKNDGSASEYIWGGQGHANGIPYVECGGRPCANGTSPFVIDPNPNQQERILAGGKSLWRTTNARTANAVDVCWAEIQPPYPAGCVTTNTCDYISAIAVAEGDSNLIWIGYNQSSVLYTTNGTLGAAACPSPSPTPTWISGDPTNVLPRNHGLTHLTLAYPSVSDPPEAARTVYATFGGFYPSTTDIRGNVWKRGSNGNWVDIHRHPNGQRGLPRTPVYSLVISPSNPDFLYVGTEVGVFASADGGMNWSPAFGGSSTDTLVYSLVSSATASEPDIVYVGTEEGVFASKDQGATWAPGFGGPANTRVAELFWMINGPNRKLVVATHGRGMFSLAAAQ